jgi:hypothetical protein
MDPILALILGLGVGHYAGDYLIQTGTQAAAKRSPGRAGCRACTAHVISYTLGQAGIVLAVLAATGAWPPATGVVAALLISAVTHWVIDRGQLLTWYSRISGRAEYWATVDGRLRIDQAAHAVALTAAVVVAAGLGGG